MYDFEKTEAVLVDPLLQSYAHLDLCSVHFVLLCKTPDWSSCLRYSVFVSLFKVLLQSIL